jgi:serpin peptidase inhibitor clade A protein 3
MTSGKFVWFGLAIAYLVVATGVHATEVSPDPSKITFAQICAEEIRRRGTELKSHESKEVLRAMVQFGLDIHKDISKAQPKKSLSTSPFSIMSMLGMLRNGAAGETAVEMHKAMGDLTKLSLAQFNQGMEELSNSLRTLKLGVILTFGNMSVVDEPYLLSPKFKADVKKYFTAEAATWDFNSPDLIPKFNKYISDNTNGMIPELLTEDDRPKLWALVNAGYYEGIWSIEFPLGATHEEGTFTLGDGSKKKTPMMNHMGATLPYFQGTGFQMASVPYRDADFTMDIIVPTVAPGETPGAALERVAAQLNEKNYTAWIKGMHAEALDLLSLPRWETESELRGEIKEALSARMPNVFSDGADLSAMFAPGTPGTKLGQVVHAVKIQTNEKGSKGAFVTFGGGLESMRSNPSLLANHPFISIIRHVPTGVPVFVTTEWDPKALPKPEDKSEPVKKTAGVDAGENDGNDEGGFEVMRVSTEGQIQMAKLNAATDALNRGLGRIETFDVLFDGKMPTFEEVLGLKKTLKRSDMVANMEADKRTQVFEILSYIMKNGRNAEFLAIFEAYGDSLSPALMNPLRELLTP